MGGNLSFQLDILTLDDGFFAFLPSVNFRHHVISPHLLVRLVFVPVLAVLVLLPDFGLHSSSKDFGVDFTRDMQQVELGTGLKSVLGLVASSEGGIQGSKGFWMSEHAGDYASIFILLSKQNVEYCRDQRLFRLVFA